MEKEIVEQIPQCDFCLTEGRQHTAMYFGKTKMNCPAHGRDANMCADHRAQFGSRKIKLLEKSGMALVMLFALFTGACMAQDRVAEIAVSQVGQHEVGGDNRGPAVRRYLQGEEGMSWCAGFVSWVLNEAGRGQLGYLRSARSYWSKGQHVSTPRPGDVIVFWRGSPAGRLGHVGIVVEVTGSRIVAVEGNVGAFPAHVREFTYHLGHIPHLLGFVRV